MRVEYEHAPMNVEVRLEELLRTRQDDVSLLARVLALVVLRAADDVSVRGDDEHLGGQRLRATVGDRK